MWGAGRAGVVATLGVLLLATGCTGDAGTLEPRTAQSCMVCHNASLRDDYSGPGIENPHPFPGADNLRCTTCHGGNPGGEGKDDSHVPPPPEIGDDAQLIANRKAYFNRLTLTGVDKFPDYQVNGTTYSALDYLQFVNPGDLRVVTEGRSCGGCHSGHADTVEGSLLATEAGVLSGAMFAAGALNVFPQSRGLHEDTAADLAFRDVTEPGFAPDGEPVGAVGDLAEFPVKSVFNQKGGDNIHDGQDLYDSTELGGYLFNDNSVMSGSPLATLYHEQVAFTCGDCHLGSSGANNRFGDFRPSGCSACHMPYSPSGRSGSSDPNVNKLEPLDPDDIDAPERPHLRSHRIMSVAKTLPSGVHVDGIDDMTCAGCHQGSNRTVMQYWGIRLDQNQDVRRGVQYPANPEEWRGTHDDQRLFDPAIGNDTFNGRNRNQYLSFEDYDGDGRDDTPMDVHHEAGMGCIDCHGSYDLHGGDVADPDSPVFSRMEQSVAIRCESCHGGVSAFAPTQLVTEPDGGQVERPVDAAGNVLDHVHKDGDGHYWLTSRLTGDVHYLPQTRDSVVASTRRHPVTDQPLYSAQASYAMGRADGSNATGIGPLQTGMASTGFAHTDSMDCASCHSAWTNTCMGCHLEGEFTTNNNNFSNITGDRIVYRERFAEFIYQSPVMFQLGVNSHDEITQVGPNTKTFYRYLDQNGQRSDVFAFSDRKGMGNNPPDPLTTPALSHNAIMAHSIRGKVTATQEGPRYCVACHLTTDSVNDFAAPYSAFRTALQNGNFGAIDFELLRDEIGKNPGNQRNSPFWVHMVAGLGSGLFLFDDQGRPQNELDLDTQRFGWGGLRPADQFDPAQVKYDLDRVVEPDGRSNASSNHALLEPGATSAHRDGATDPEMAGPLGAWLVERLADPSNGIVLDSWVDANGAPQGDAASHLGSGP
jgi:hypothetical protein